MDQERRENNERIAAALGYVFLLFFIPLSRKDSPFCQFHARQGIALFLAWCVVSFFIWIPLVGGLAWILMLVLNIVLFVRALNGEEWEMPYLGKYAKQIKL